MSPPLAELDNETETSAKRNHTVTHKQLLANQANARRSRGPGAEAKKHTRFNARVHDLRSESEILPGEDRSELDRRLEVWPQIMGADNEVELFAAHRVVHLGWRMERAERSEDAATTKVELALAQVEEARQTEEARLLGLELDNDTDLEGVVGKLLATPAGCTLLLTEFSNFSIRVNDYNVLIWSSRERLFHCLGKRLEDLFNGDPVIHDWLVAMLGTVYGDRGEGKAQAIAEVLYGLRPDWMDQCEFDARMDALSNQLSDTATSAALVRTYLEDVIVDLNEWLKLARSNTEYLLGLSRKAAWVDDSPAGARRLNYKLGHGRSFDAAFRRFDALKNGGEPKAAPSKAKRAPARAAAAAVSPVVKTTSESVVTNDPSLTDRAASAATVTKADTLGEVVTITNDPIRDPIPIEPTATVTKADTLGEVVTITNDPIRAQADPVIVAEGHDRVPEVLTVEAFAGMEEVDSPDQGVPGDAPPAMEPWPSLSFGERPDPARGSPGGHTGSLNRCGGDPPLADAARRSLTPALSRGEREPDTVSAPLLPGEGWP